MVENPDRRNPTAFLGLIQGLAETDNNTKQGFTPLGSQFTEQSFVTLPTVQHDQPFRVKGLSTPWSEQDAQQMQPR